jgi:hypothetical protein
VIFVLSALTKEGNAERVPISPGIRGSVLIDVYSLTAFKQREETAKYEVNFLEGFWSPDKY